MTHVLPDENSIHEMLSRMFGDNMTVTPGKAFNFDDSTCTAVYVNPEDAPGAVIVCDFPFAAYSGGALSMMPVGGVEDAIEEAELSEQLRGNLYEVMNICTRLLIDDNTVHLRLTEVVPSQEASDVLETVTSSDATRVDFQVDIPKYGAGTLSFVVT